VDVVANVLLPDAAELPVKLATVAGYVTWARRSAGLSWRELGLGRSEVGSGLKWGAAAVTVVAGVVVLLAAVSQAQFEQSGRMPPAQYEATKRGWGSFFDRIDERLSRAVSEEG